MKQLLEHAIQQLNKLDDKLDNIDKTLVKQEVNLAEHMRRTDLLEKKLDKDMEILLNDLEPIEKHVERVKGVTKFLVWAVPITLTVAGIIYKLI